MKKSLFNFLCSSIFLLISALTFSQAGRLDYSFFGLSNITGQINSFANQSDGKTIIVGSFTSINGTNINRVARLNIDGSLDSTFNVGTGILGGFLLNVNQVVVQPDDKILIGGTFNTYNGNSSPNLVRLNPNGEIDNTFNIGTGFVGIWDIFATYTVNSVTKIKIKSNGQIVIAGGFSSYNGTNVKRLLVLNADGSIDNSFNADHLSSSVTNVQTSISAIELQNDSKIILHLSYRTKTSSSLALATYTEETFLKRINANGSIDTSFTKNNIIFSTGSSNGNTSINPAKIVRDIFCYTDNKILIAGNFINVYGNNYKSIARLSSNGNIDNTFSIGSGFNSDIYSIDLQIDNKIIAGGNFTTFNGNNSKGIIRLLSNGGFDSSFNSGNGITNNTSINYLKVLPNNKILVVGTFSSYNNITRNQIARLHLSCNYSPIFDLMVKDSSDDTGIEPNTVTPYMWTSDNIWVRNYNDNGLEHQNPDYSATGNANFVRVRVINNSCVTSLGNEQLKLYWAKASTALSYPNPWMGGITYAPTGASMGSPIGTLNIPVLQPGEETILTFPWIVPNPNNYGTDGDQWHFCLLARITATNDPMTSTETTDLNANVRNNNNIAWKNVTVVDVLPNNTINPGGIIAVGNPFNHPKTFFLEMEISDLETGKPIYEEAEIGIKMDDILYNAWVRGGKEAQLLDSTIEEKRKIVKGNKVILDNLSFDANEIGTLRLDFNFLTKELTDKTNYAYHVIQKDSENGKIIGGETFIVNKTPRESFEANANNDLEVDLNQSITISADDINEPAIYNWYDNEGNLIYQGKNLEIANAVSEKYKLEVISTVDGFKDYVEVEVKIKPSTLETISPNPAENNVKIGYKLNTNNSAYLMILGYYGSNGTSNNYILDVNSNEININVSNYPSGFYSVALVIDGNIIDAKTLIKQ